MKRFLFTTLVSNDLGLLTRSLPIARELQRRGHQVVFCNPARAPSKVISDAGFDNLYPQWSLLDIMVGNANLSNVLRLLRSKHVIRDMGNLVSLSRNVMQFSTAEIWDVDHFSYLMGLGIKNYVRAGVDTLMELIGEYVPDAVVDFWNPIACIAARASHKPLVSVIQADMHPHSRGFIWWKGSPPKIPNPVPVINSILAELHLKPVSKIGELFIGDKTLVVGMPETDPLPDTANVVYIGAILWQRAGEKLPDWVADLSKTKPVIWIYPGNPQYFPGVRSFGDSAVIIYACIEALKDENVQVVLSTGHHPLPKDALHLPSNFRHVSFVPGLAMAERSDLIIHHGGYGSCQTGLFTGTPALVIPTFSERESNARRVALVGAGDFVLPTADVSGRKKHVKAAEVRDKVNRILADSSFRENAKRISEKLRSYGGASYAASLIEGCV